MALQQEQIDRFRRDLDALIAPGERLGLAVSGGTDSMALLLLAAEARPGRVAAATVDHGLRAEGATEAELVSQVCARLGVPHSILTVEWREVPESAVQERARAARYAELGRWARAADLSAIAAAHQRDDQAETLLMRLARGSGVRGLAAIRRSAPLPGACDVRLLRPLLGWSRAELHQVCADAGVTPVADPSNADRHYERVRVRQALGSADWLDPAHVTRSAALLGEADAALEWATDAEWRRGVAEDGAGLAYRPSDAPDEIRRRIVARALLRLAREGPDKLRGRELDQLLATLDSDGTATLRGVKCIGGETWRFIAAPNRTRRDPPFG